MIYVYWLIGYIIGILIALAYCRWVSYSTLKDKEERNEQLFFDLIVSAGWLPLLCIFGSLGIVHLINKVRSK